jgi:hypothetical protein
MEQNDYDVRHPGQGTAPELKVLLLYEDAETGLRAKRSVAALHGQGDVDASVETRLWRLDLLSTAWLREQAAAEAVDADVIIVSLHGDDELPEAMREWLSLWLERKANRPYALGVLLDAGPVREDHAPQVAGYLETVATVGGADLLWGFCETPSANLPEMDRAGAPSHMVREPNADLYHAGRYSHWGINE